MQACYDEEPFPKNGMGLKPCVISLHGESGKNVYAIWLEAVIMCTKARFMSPVIVNA